MKCFLECPSDQDRVLQQGSKKSAHLNSAKNRADNCVKVHKYMAYGWLKYGMRHVTKKL